MVNGLLGLKEIPQQPLRLVHRGEEIGIEVADARRGHRLQDPRGHVAGAGPHQHAGPGSRSRNSLGSIDTLKTCSVATLVDGIARPVGKETWKDLPAARAGIAGPPNRQAMIVPPAAEASQMRRRCGPRGPRGGKAPRSLALAVAALAVAALAASRHHIQISSHRFHDAQDQRRA